LLPSTPLADTAWNAYDEGYLSAYKWARSLRGGAGLPVEAVAIPLQPGEVAHAHIPAVAFAAYYAAASRYQPSFFVFGGPVGLAVTASVQYGRDAAWRAQAQRAGVPRWHPVGLADVVVTNERLLLTGEGRTGSLSHSETAPVQLVAGLGGGPAVQLEPAGEPPLQLESPWAPVLYVFVRQIVDGRPPAVPMPAAVLERAEAEGRL
jgi:hypothetical protein